MERETLKILKKKKIDERNFQIPSFNEWNSNYTIKLCINYLNALGYPPALTLLLNVNLFSLKQYIIRLQVVLLQVIYKGNKTKK